MAMPKEQLQAMRSLQENWDGYGAAAPQARALDLAYEFVDLLEAMLNSAAADASRLHVSPTRVGGILIEWDDPATQREIENNPDVSIAFLHLNKKTGQIDTRKFSSDSTALLHELRLLLTMLPKRGGLSSIARPAAEINRTRHLSSPIFRNPAVGARPERRLALS